MPDPKFILKKENFICDVCGHQVIGTGYTDHCSNCLWSKHIDENPGDRVSVCHGLMEPIGIDQKKGEWRIHYRCQKCGFKKVNQMVKEDNREVLTRLS